MKAIKAKTPLKMIITRSQINLFTAHKGNNFKKILLQEVMEQFPSSRYNKNHEESKIFLENLFTVANKYFIKTQDGLRLLLRILIDFDLNIPISPFYNEPLNAKKMSEIERLEKLYLVVASQRVHLVDIKPKP
ncbi:MAG: hypothetical protein ABI378_14965 [Chitinophagaceae bacterium]